MVFQLPNKSSAPMSDSFFIAECEECLQPAAERRLVFSPARFAAIQHVCILYPMRFQYADFDIWVPTFEMSPRTCFLEYRRSFLCAQNQVNAGMSRLARYAILLMAQFLYC